MIPKQARPWKDIIAHGLVIDGSENIMEILLQRLGLEIDNPVLMIYVITTKREEDSL